MLKIKTNSKLVEPGDTFVAIKGNTVDGHKYIEEAIKKGARFIIAEHGEYRVPTLIVPDTTEYLKEHLKEEYAKDFNDLKFIGITGTNGKTTTALLTSETLNELGESSAYIGTVGFYINGKLVKELPNTTPDVLSLYNLIYEAKEQGVKYIVMEVSSHALSLGRIEGINFDAAAFTNLTEDHLDYHKTMEEYLKAKQKILTHLKPNAKMIVNNDDPHAQDFETNSTIKIGKTGDISFLDYEPDATGTKLWFKYFNRQFGTRINLLCEFNIYNYLTSLGLVTSLGFDPKEVINCASKLKPPKGRNEVIGINGARAIIDYAHTPDAVEKIISSNREVTTGRIITIVGCGGNRDPLKRPIMGNIASNLSDFVIFTDDNPREENELDILKDILKGVNEDNFIVEPDRRKAIISGLNMIKPGDTLLILGKGHEDYQIIGREKHHFSDKEEVDAYIQKLNQTKQATL